MSVKPDVTFHFRFRRHLLVSLSSRSIFSYARFPRINPTVRHSLSRPSDVMDLIGKDQENGSPPKGKLPIFIVKLSKEIVSENELLL